MIIYEPAVCQDCGVMCEVDDLNRASLDAYADLSVDYDLQCAVCGGTNIKLLKPLEDSKI